LGAIFLFYAEIIDKNRKNRAYADLGHISMGDPGCDPKASGCISKHCEERTWRAHRELEKYGCHPKMGPLFNFTNHITHQNSKSPSPSHSMPKTPSNVTFNNHMETANTA